MLAGTRLLYFHYSPRTRRTRATEGLNWSVASCLFTHFTTPAVGKGCSTSTRVALANTPRAISSTHSTQISEKVNRNYIRYVRDVGSALTSGKLFFYPTFISFFVTLFLYFKQKEQLICPKLPAGSSCLLHVVVTMAQSVGG